MKTILKTAALALALAAPLAVSAPAQQPVDPQIPADTEIVTLDSGLKYSVLVPGAGEERAATGAKVRVHYTGWTTDGKVFDSSRQRGEPAEFTVGGLIEGWNEALTMMPVGARWKLTIPSDLGYGAKGAPPRIPANAELIFDVELIAILEPAPTFVAWDPEVEAKPLTTGGRVQVRQAGEGDKVKDSGYVRFRWSAWGPEGELYGSHTMNGDLSGSPQNIPIQFLREGLGDLAAGGMALIEVPRASGREWLRRLKVSADPENSYWRVEVLSAQTFTQPAFVLPPDEELTSTPSGLKYKVLTEGTGAKPDGPQSAVTVHYSGWLTDGTLFDSSYERGQPASFGLNQVISGWTEGVQLVGEGGKILLVIPSDLGYGDRGSPPKIPGGATLVFVVELLNAG